MKALFALLSLALSSAAYADTLQILDQPQPAPAHRIGTPVRCAAINFAADGSIYGTCQYVGYCSARYCKGPWTYYVATWDQNGVNPVLGALCGSRASYVSYPTPVIYTDGHSAADCVVDFYTGTGMVVDGYSFQYVSTRLDGAMLLDLNNGASYLWMP